jgi:diguanylate cyclase (GGDEF)-like protein
MDIHTLHVEHAVLLGLYTFLTFVNSWLHPGTKGVHWFPIYNLCAFVGAVLILLRGHIPDVISILLGDLFFPIAYVFLHRCLTEFFGHGATQWQLQTCLVGASFAALVQYGWLHPNTATRLIFFSAFLTIQLTMSAYLVFRNAGEYLKISGGLMGLVLLLLGISNFIRFVGVILYGAPKNYLHGNTLLAWTLIDNSVLQGAVTVCFVWMTAATLHHDLQTQASTDPLTGLLNRRAIEFIAEREITVSQQSGQPLSAILIDLDGFKQINDTYGHKCGDLVLISVSNCLQNHLREQELLARIGGDEFVVLLPQTSIETAKKTAERLRTSLEQWEIAYGSFKVRVHASFGISEIQSPTHDWDHLIMCCDKALYSVKGGGGNLVAVL